ncbi:hypothetical protein DIPPA_06411 [Diplonema papillatum]|nr:hypothetical protein DIPPA_06411 [Diplonema papillatum]
MTEEDPTHCPATGLPYVGVPIEWSSLSAPNLLFIGYVDKISIDRGLKQRKILILTYQKLILAEADGPIGRVLDTYGIAKLYWKRVRQKAATTYQVLLIFPSNGAKDLLVTFPESPNGGGEERGRRCVEVVDRIRQTQQLLGPRDQCAPLGGELVFWNGSEELAHDTSITRKASEPYQRGTNPRHAADQDPLNGGKNAAGSRAGDLSDASFLSNSAYSCPGFSPLKASPLDSCGLAVRSETPDPPKALPATAVQKHASATLAGSPPENSSQTEWAASLRSEAEGSVPSEKADPRAASAAPPSSCASGGGGMGETAAAKAPPDDMPASDDTSPRVRHQAGPPSPPPQAVPPHGDVGGSICSSGSPSAQQPGPVGPGGAAGGGAMAPSTACIASREGEGAAKPGGHACIASREGEGAAKPGGHAFTGSREGEGAAKPGGHAFTGGREGEGAAKPGDHACIASREGEGAAKPGDHACIASREGEGAAKPGGHACIASREGEPAAKPGGHGAARLQSHYGASLVDTASKQAFAQQLGPRQAPGGDAAKASRVARQGRGPPRAVAAAAAAAAAADDDPAYRYPLRAFLALPQPAGAQPPPRPQPGAALRGTAAAARELPNAPPDVSGNSNSNSNIHSNSNNNSKNNSKIHSNSNNNSKNNSNIHSNSNSNNTGNIHSSSNNNNSNNNSNINSNSNRNESNNSNSKPPGPGRLLVRESEVCESPKKLPPAGAASPEAARPAPGTPAPQARDTSWSRPPSHGAGCRTDQFSQGIVELLTRTGALAADSFAELAFCWYEGVRDGIQADEAAARDLLRRIYSWEARLLSTPGQSDHASPSRNASSVGKQSAHALRKRSLTPTSNPAALPGSASKDGDEDVESGSAGEETRGKARVTMGAMARWFVASIIERAACEPPGTPPPPLHPASPPATPPSNPPMQPGSGESDDTTRSAGRVADADSGGPAPLSAEPDAQRHKRVSPSGGPGPVSNAVRQVELGRRQPAAQSSSGSEPCGAHPTHAERDKQQPMRFASGWSDRDVLHHAEPDAQRHSGSPGPFSNAVRQAAFGRQQPAAQCSSGPTHPTDVERGKQQPMRFASGWSDRDVLHHAEPDAQRHKPVSSSGSPGPFSNAVRQAELGRQLPAAQQSSGGSEPWGAHPAHAERDKQQPMRFTFGWSDRDESCRRRSSSGGGSDRDDSHRTGSGKKRPVRSSSGGGSGSDRDAGPAHDGQRDKLRPGRPSPGWGPGHEGTGSSRVSVDGAHLQFGAFERPPFTMQRSAFGCDGRAGAERFPRQDSMSTTVPLASFAHPDPWGHFPSFWTMHSVPCLTPVGMHSPAGFQTVALPYERHHSAALRALSMGLSRESTHSSVVGDVQSPDIAQGRDAEMTGGQNGGEEREARVRRRSKETVGLAESAFRKVLRGCGLRDDEIDSVTDQLGVRRSGHLSFITGRELRQCVRSTLVERLLQAFDYCEGDTPNCFCVPLSSLASGRLPSYSRASSVTMTSQRF